MRHKFLILSCLLFAVPLAAQVSIDEEPRDNLVIQVEDARRQWKIRPIRVTDRNGVDLSGARSADLRVVTERWERTGRPRRYDIASLKAAVERYIGPGKDPEGARFYFNVRDPRQPRSDYLTLVNERLGEYWVPASKVEIVGYPQTWIDIYERFVTSQNGDARRQAVKNWEEAHRDVIRNPENSDYGFSQQERNEFARFYQQQFVYIRDRNPKLASIYDELAAFHHERNNLDAELSTYMDALRVGVESPDRERFALAVGRIFVNRLNLPGEAIAYLDRARNHTEALYLLARCHFARKNYDRTRQELNALIDLLSAPPDDGSIILESTPEQELGRAHYMLGELEFKLHDFDAMEKALAAIPEENESGDAARVLHCAMLLQRNLPRVRGVRERSDHSRVRDLVKTVSFWSEAETYANPAASTVYPLDPLMARTLVIFAQADPQFSQQINPDDTPRPNAEVIRYLDAAKALDPLSPEPYLAEGRLLRHLGRFGEAFAAFEAGLDVNPKHVLLNYHLADLNRKSGLISIAKDHLERCLKEEPEFYPAHVMLGEIAISDIEEIRESLLIRIASGIEVDFGGELVPPMKEAAAFFTGALAINPDQPDTELALATLYLRLSEVVPSTVNDRGKAEAVRRAYLVNARDMSRKLVDQLEAMAEAGETGGTTARERARVPSLAAYNVLGFALYSLGDHGGALEAFRNHIVNAYDKSFVPDSRVRKEYEGSRALRYATEWRRRIERNQRQYYEIEEFDRDSEKHFWGEWYIPQLLKPDLDFKNEAKIRNGKLILDVTQDETDVISRFETTRRHSTLSVFEAEFTTAGDMFLDRGIHINKARKASSASTSSEPRAEAGLMLGIDADGRVFWETRKYKVEDKDQKEELKEHAVINVAEYGGMPLNPDEKVTLALRRQLSDDGSEIEFIAVINNYEVRLPVQFDELTKNDFNNSRWVVMCGFFTRGMQGAKGTIEVERARFVYDGGLGEKR